MSFDELNFTTTPNFKFKEYIKETAECLGVNFTFDCYKDDEGVIYLISPYYDEKNLEEKKYPISIIDIKNNEISMVLEGHEDRVITARYFQDPNTKFHYLISADRKGHVIAWDLTQGGKIIYYETFTYKSFIYSVLLMFEKINDKNIIIYAVISTIGNEETKVVNINEKDNKEVLKDSQLLKVYFLTYWWDEKNKAHNIISCGNSKIVIDEFKPGTQGNQGNHTVFDSNNEINYLGAMVFEKEGKNLLITSSTSGSIKVFDLDTKTEAYNQKYEGVFFYSFVKWNDEYILLMDSFEKKIFVIDINDNYKVKSKVLCPKMHFERFMRKIDHPLYGESILSVGIDWKIKLFINRNIR